MENQTEVPPFACCSTKSKLMCVSAGLVVLVIVAIASFFFGRASVKSASLSQTLPTPTIAVLPTSIPTPDETADWKTYTNARYGYSLKYPKEASVSFAKKDDFSYETEQNGEPKLEELKQIPTDKRFEYLFNKFSGEICVGVDYKFGHISISARENNQPRYVICSPTGVGVSAKATEESVNVGGKIYQASGMLMDDPNINNLSSDGEFLTVDLKDGTRITYGSKYDKTATYEDYLKQKNVLLQILSTFKFLD